MKWIRGPSWDCIWFLSPPALGLLMIAPAALSPVWFPAVLAGFLCLSFSHSISPIVLSWTHSGFRGVMLSQPGKFIAVPAIVILTGVGTAIGTWLLFPSFVLPRSMVLENMRFDQLTVPVMVWANLYAVWNLYHFGAQNFGFLSLYRRRSFGRWRWPVLALMVTISATLAHGSRFLGSLVFLFVFGVTSGGHWLQAIGLCAHVDSRHNNCSPFWFVVVIVAAGSLLLWGFRVVLGISDQMAILALSLRAALGIWHFLQDRWLWQLSDPQVRATIGKELFA